MQAADFAPGPLFMGGGSHGSEQRQGPGYRYIVLNGSSSVLGKFTRKELLAAWLGLQQPAKLKTAGKQPHNNSVQFSGKQVSRPLVLRLGGGRGDFVVRQPRRWTPEQINHPRAGLSGT